MDNIKMVFDKPEKSSRGLLLLRFLAPIYVGIPHGIALTFRMIATVFIAFIAWWIVLFTGCWHLSLADARYRLSGGADRQVPALQR